MRRRKYKKIFGPKSIIYITMIVALSTMGVGYAAWSSGLSINMGITTGFIARSINLENLGYSDLNYRLSDDDMTLYITGEVNQNSSQDISIEIEDTGSIPTILNSVDELSTTKIVNFGGQSRNRYNHSSLLARDADVVETFQININARENNDNIMVLRSNTYVQVETNDIQDEISYIQNEIDKTREEIRDIQKEIDRLLNLREKHNFKYNLKFQQGL